MKYIEKEKRKSTRPKERELHELPDKWPACQRGGGRRRWSCPTWVWWAGGRGWADGRRTPMCVSGGRGPSADKSGVCRLLSSAFGPLPITPVTESGQNNRWELIKDFHPFIFLSSFYSTVIHVDGKWSQSCRHFLEIDLFHSLPALYSEGFIEYT